MSVSQLREMSNRYGANPEYVLAGGGNTSFKDRDTIYVKGSGTALATIGEDGFVRLDRKALDQIFSNTYPEGEEEREAAVLKDLLAARAPEEEKRPSVETLLHNVYPTAFVLHLHPAVVNGLTCGKDGHAAFEKLFGDEGIWIEPIMPGYILAERVKTDIAAFEKKHGHLPSYIFLENHGVFTGADTVKEVDRLFAALLAKLSTVTSAYPDLSPCEFDTEKAVQLAPAVRCLCGNGNPGVAVFRTNAAVMRFCASKEAFSSVYTTFSPDHMVYCRSSAVFLEAEETEALYAELAEKLREYDARSGCKPCIVGVKGLGYFACGATKKEAGIASALFLDAVKVAVYTEAFGGGKPMPAALVKSIEGWEVERYRKSVALCGSAPKRLDGKVTVITGSAQGFGKGIAEDLARVGAYIGVADMNGEGAAENAASLCETHGPGAAMGIRVNVTDEADVKAMMDAVTLAYGGLDLFVNNAGIVRAGSLDEMDKRSFELVTNVNYTAYFLCVKYASKVMKLQHRFAPGLYMDIVQVNSKSGLSGSNKNFAYAGSKFGGIGLTESFALELVGYNIKVNSVCPGNFLDGPLWCDPEKGLFLQYLKAGKVPGAKTVEDVKRFYEGKVPMNRGCQVRDVSRAICYCVEQQYETGQAIPVTGGQEMLK